MTEEELLPILRKKYIEDPPEGYTADDIREMPDEDLLDMDYFLNEDQEFFEEEELLPIIRQQYIDNPPAGYTADDIKNMPDEILLDLHFYLTDDF